MSSAFEYYFPPILYNVELIGEDKKMYDRLVECIKEERKEKRIEEILISERRIGRLIGRNGRIINKIRRKSGAYIKIYDKLNDENRRIEIMGDMKSINNAREMICECVKSVKKVKKGKKCEGIE